MDRDFSRVEPLPRLERHPSGGAHPPWRQSGRAKLFGLVFGITILMGVIWTLLQPAVYRSSATVLMSAPSAIDAMATEVDIQSVAIQRRILLGRDITRRLLAQIGDSHALGLDSSYLRDVLQVDPVPDTNLVEMIAQGEDSRVLPILVNTWIDVYLEVRAQDIQLNKQQTLQIVEGELDGLTTKLEETREELADYRNENDIISAERQENEVLARLDGLNSALNTAIEEEVKTRAYLDTLREILRRGQSVVPQSERRDLETLETELRELQVQMLEMTKRYTMEYINKQPNLRDIPARIEELEGQLAMALAQGRDTELAAAQQAHAAALQTVGDLQQKLDDQKQQVAQFNTIYATHQALVEDLARLEEVNREAQARLVQVEVRQVDKYPQVSVIDRSGEESERIGPDYLVLLGGTLAAALGLGVLSVWLYGFLGPRTAEPAYVTLSGVHMYPQEVSGKLAYTPQPNPKLDGAATRLLEGQEGDLKAPEKDIDRI